MVDPYLDDPTKKSVLDDRVTLHDPPHFFDPMQTQGRIQRDTEQGPAQ